MPLLRVKVVCCSLENSAAPTCSNISGCCAIIRPFAACELSCGYNHFVWCVLAVLRGCSVIQVFPSKNVVARSCFTTTSWVCINTRPVRGSGHRSLPSDLVCFGTFVGLLCLST
jgi:hypothetical protein